MSKFLANLQEKAHASGLYKPANAAHPTGDTQGHSHVTPSTGGRNKNSPTVANLTHQLRQFQQQHLNPLASASTKSVQLAITAQKGIALDHDTLSRDLTLLAKEQEGWLKSMAIQPTPVPGGAVVADNASVISETTSAAAAIYDAPPTQTLYGLTHQLSSLHKLLSTKLLDARTPLKDLRNLQTDIEDREARLREASKKHTKASSTTVAVDMEEQMERLQAEIKELSYGLKGKREDAAKLGQRKVWEGYEEFAKGLLVLSHAAHELIDLMPESTTVTEKVPVGLQQERVRAVEEGVRRSLGGLDGGWSIKIDDVALSRQRSSSPRPLRTRSSSINRGTPSPASSGRFIPPAIPQHVVEIEQMPVQADVIAAYPSSHLNNDPAPIPSTSPLGSPGGTYMSGAAGLTAPKPKIHRHHSSFDRPIDDTPIIVPGADTRALSGSAVESESPAYHDSPMDTSAGVSAQHPTIAETGIPISSADPGPAKGQLERREPPQKTDDIVKLGSFGGADVPRPNVNASSDSGERQDYMPGGYGGYAQQAQADTSMAPPAYPASQGMDESPSAPAHPVYAPPPAHTGQILPPPQHPATLGTHGHAQNPFEDPSAASLQGMSPRDQAAYQLQQKGYHPE
ncbi:hypothetical protein QFC24_000929 [Naganishia onofrii]|uniref:Uncharacterized protein n=1 Tax=Naganishia onofrii TaxID=1851511 RepID=A0ACC2XV91_9TREE|nr:hypothetical protein QFC24_000929 [Naganishia onofrii]